jgi:hypothetical protein
MSVRFLSFPMLAALFGRSSGVVPRYSRAYSVLTPSLLLLSKPLRVFSLSFRQYIRSFPHWETSNCAKELYLLILWCHFCRLTLTGTLSDALRRCQNSTANSNAQRAHTRGATDMFSTAPLHMFEEYVLISAKKYYHGGILVIQSPSHHTFFSTKCSACTPGYLRVSL